MDYIFSNAITLLAATIRMSVPLILTALAGLYSERSGVVDIGLEGKMLSAAFAGAAAAAVSGSVYVGLAAAILVSVSLALIHGYASITQRGNQIVSGTAINFVAAGATPILGQAWFNQGGRTPALGVGARLETIPFPFADSIGQIPVIGPIYAHILSGQYLMTYFAFAMVPITWWVLYRTRFGLRLRAVGENPGAVDTAGISVVRLRYMAIICGAVLCGLAGAYLSMALNAGFVKNMSAGRGFIALAALVFANWRPKNILYTCLLFGFLDALSIFAQNAQLPYFNDIPDQAMQALPYILTVVLLAGFIGKASPPKASGTPYVKER
jgi:simple sugar transport system permease protein